MNLALRIEHLSKHYRLGAIGRQTLQADLQRWWARVRKQPDPFQKIGAASNVSGDSLWALRDVGLDVREGEVIGLIGRNGAGKSTLLKILARVTAPTTGCVKVRGRVASLLEVGTGFHPDLTGRENIMLNGAIFGMTRAEVRAKFDEIVEFSGLAAFIDTPVKRYSSGMYVRLAFAVAANLECEILLVDEILAVADAEFQKRCLGKMQDVTRQHRTLIFVSHNLATVSALCTRGLLLDRGRMVSDGPVGDVLRDYVRMIGEGRAANLDANEDRAGSGRARLRRVRLNSGDGSDTETLQSGGTYAWELDYESDHSIVAPRVIMSIHDSLWRRVACLDSEEGGGLPGIVEATGTLRCVMERLPLPPAAYSMTIELFEGGDLLDRVERAYDFDITEGDFFGTGMLHRLRTRICLISNRWTVGTERETAVGPWR